MNDKPFVLAFDTAMQGCSAAVMHKGSGQCFATTEPMARGQSERLVPMIGEVMARAGADYADLGLIVTTVGPGAFTGLRIGIATARALALALNCPVTGLTTTETIARAYTPQARSAFAVILETKRTDFYFQLFGKDGVPHGEAQAADASVLLGVLRPGTVVLGDGADRFISEGGQADGYHMESGFLLPDPSVMARMGIEKPVISPEPLYLRDADVSKPKKTPRSIV